MAKAGDIHIRLGAELKAWVDNEVARLGLERAEWVVRVIERERERLRVERLGAKRAGMAERVRALEGKEGIGGVAKGSERGGEVVMAGELINME